MTSEYSKENEKILRELLEKLKQYFNDAWTIKNIVYTVKQLELYIDQLRYYLSVDSDWSVDE